MTRFAGIISLFFCVCSNASAQSISGRVVDSSNVPIAGVAVILQRPDSSYVDAVATNADGRFMFSSGIKSCRLLFEHLCYETMCIESSKPDMGEIVMADAFNRLDSVVVTGKRPIVKVADGKLAYDLTVLAERHVVDNAFDAISKLPGITESDGSFSLAGVPDVTIVLNGKPTLMPQEQLIQLLRSTSVERVGQVEVVYNAPPEWHVKGAAINVSIRKNDDHTVQGYLRGGWSNDSRNSYSGRGSFYYSEKKFAINLMYAYTDDKTASRDDFHSHHTVNGITTEIKNSSKVKNTEQSHNVYADLGYEFSEESGLSLSYSGCYTPHSASTDRSVDSYFGNTLSRNKDRDFLHNISLNYTAPFGLTAGADHTWFRMHGLQTMDYADIPETYCHAFDYRTSQHIGRLNVYADMKHSLEREWTLKYGMQYRFVKNDNAQQYDDSAKTVSRTREHTAECYVGFGKSWLDGRLRLDISMKEEYYKINEYEKWSLMPNAGISYSISNGHYIEASYLSLRQYPSYWQLQDYFSYSNRYIAFRGNPSLRPKKYQVAELLYMLKNQYYFQLSYYLVKDYFFLQAYQSPDKLQLLYQRINIDYTSALYATIVAPFAIGKIIESELTVTGSRERYKAKEWHDLSFDRSKWSAIVELDNTIRLSDRPKIAFSVYGGYKSPTIQGIWDLSQSWFLDAGISWAFAKKQALLRFKCKNILGALSHPRITTDYESQHYSVDSRYFKRVFLLDFSYRFGGNASRSSKEIDTSRFGK